MRIGEFLATRLSEDEQLARECSGAPWVVDVPGLVHVDAEAIARIRALRQAGYVATTGAREYGRHIARHDPARVLREAAATRAILAEHHQWEIDGITGCDVCDAGHETGDPSPGPCATLRALAAVWSDHPDYDEDWAALIP